MERIRVPELTVRVDGARIPAYTELAYAGAHQLTLSTALPALALELHSCYLGHPQAAEAIAAHLAFAPDADPQTWARTHPGEQLPVMGARRRCLYDHALELQELLSDSDGGVQVTVELSENALELLDVA